MRDIEKLGEAPVGRILLSNCMHSSAALLVYSIYNITDTLIVSWGVNETAAGAIAVVSPVMLMLSAVSTTMGSRNHSKCICDIVVICYYRHIDLYIHCCISNNKFKKERMQVDEKQNKI